MNRTELLAAKLDKIYAQNFTEIRQLVRAFEGPKGGHNAKHITGWWCCGRRLTLAAKQSFMPVRKWWDGAAPTPCACIPACVRLQAEQALKEVYGGIEK